MSSNSDAGGVDVLRPAFAWIVKVNEFLKEKWVEILLVPLIAFFGYQVFDTKNEIVTFSTKLNYVEIRVEGNKNSIGVLNTRFGHFDIGRAFDFAILTGKPGTLIRGFDQTIISATAAAQMLVIDGKNGTESLYVWKGEYTDTAKVSAIYRLAGLASNSYRVAVSVQELNAAAVYNEDTRAIFPAAYFDAENSWIIYDGSLISDPKFRESGWIFKARRPITLIEPNWKGLINHINSR